MEHCKIEIGISKFKQYIEKSNKNKLYFYDKGRDSTGKILFKILQGYLNIGECFQVNSRLITADNSNKKIVCLKVHKLDSFQ